MTLRAPFPWFGGKSRAADLIWQRLGDVPNYVEPFAGSLAVMLARPHAPRIETVNDADCYLANFWRATAHDPEAVAEWCDWPVNEADLHARHRWLVAQSDFRERMLTEPDFYDAKIAAWWVWGISQWIGSGWCDMSRLRGDGRASEVPHLGSAGMGVHRTLPHLGDAGRGVHRKLPHLGDAGRGETYSFMHRVKLGAGSGVTAAGVRDNLLEVFAALGARLRSVRVACGEWDRVCTPSVTHRHGLTGVVLDPPYGEGSLDYAAGGNANTALAADVHAWARENGDNPLLRIALCGYEGQHEPIPGWECVEWKAHGGYGAGRGTDADKNSYRERIWFSPHCLGARQLDMFAMGGT